MEGRLHTTLNSIGVTTPSKFGLYIASGNSYSDQEITSVTIHQGADSRSGGYNPSTMEIQVTGLPAESVSTGRQTRFALSDSGASQLAAYLGIPVAFLQDRYNGRIGRVSVDDNAGKFRTTYTSASWATMLNHVGNTVTPIAGQSLHSVIAGLCNYPNSPFGIEMVFHGTTDSIADTQEPINFSNGIQRYAEDVGILLRQRRNGMIDVMDLEHRKNRVDALLPITMPLTRSQAITPTVWEQPNESIGIKIDYEAKDQAGTNFTQLVDATAGDSRIRELVNVDWKHIKTTPSGKLYQEAYARVYERSPRQFRLPGLKIDLLYLLRSNVPYHKEQAKQLLSMETGDPVFLSHDWPWPVQGVHFAQGLTETITPDKWEIELTLYPYAQITGYAPTPDVPARIWESATNAWDTETRIWNQA